MKKRVFKLTNSEELDLVRAEVIKACRRCNLDSLNEVRVVTAVMEVAYNTSHYAKKGKITVRELKRGIEIVIEDKGPGIEEVEKAMKECYSTHNGPGLGLPVAKTLMDEFEITSKLGVGTKIVMRKFQPLL